jgi:hypothetical protein
MYFDLHVPPERLEAALSVQAHRLARPEFTADVLTNEAPPQLDYVRLMEFGIGPDGWQGGTTLLGSVGKPLSPRDD